MAKHADARRKGSRMAAGKGMENDAGRKLMEEGSEGNDGGR